MGVFAPRRRRFLGMIASGAASIPLGAGQGTANTERRLPQPAADEPVDFDPVADGFGFPNWEGDTGTGANGVEFSYEAGEVSMDEVRGAIEDSWTTVLSEAATHLMTRIVYSWIGGNAATNGHCYGMVFAADEYARGPSALPGDVEVASEIPHPTDEFGPVGDRIRELQTAQLLRAEVYWFGLLGLRWGLGDHRESLEELRAAIDDAGSGGLVLNGSANAHQVLAYGYEQTDEGLEVSVYDPNYAAADHADSDEPWSLIVDEDTGTVHTIEQGYDEFLFHHPRMDPDTMDRLIGGRERVVDNLSNAVFLGLEAGGTLDLAASDDVLVDRPEAQYAASEGAAYADVATVFGPIEEFAFAIDGEIGTEFTLETIAIRDDELVLEEIVSGTLDAVPARLQLTLDEAGDLAVDVVEGTEEVAEGAEQTVEDTEDSRWIRTDGWRPAIGGALGLGAAYWDLLGRVDDGD